MYCKRHRNHEIACVNITFRYYYYISVHNGEFAAFFFLNTVPDIRIYICTLYIFPYAHEKCCAIKSFVLFFTYFSSAHQKKYIDEVILQKHFVFSKRLDIVSDIEKARALFHCFGCIYAVCIILCTNTLATIVVNYSYRYIFPHAHFSGAFLNYFHLKSINFH